MRLLVVGLVAGCTFTPNQAGRDARGPDGSVHGDAPASIDAAVTSDAPPGCDGAGSLIVCVSGTPTSGLALSDLLIDTDACIGGQKLGQPGGPVLCVLSGTTVTIDGLVRAEGSLPLAIDATQSLSIASNALLDVSSSRANGPGAGANSSDCTMVAGTNDMLGGGGGAGGSGAFSSTAM